MNSYFSVHFFLVRDLQWILFGHTLLQEKIDDPVRITHTHDRIVNSNHDTLKMELIGMKQCEYTDPLDICYVKI